MGNLNKRIESLEKTLADHNISSTPVTEDSRETESDMLLSPNIGPKQDSMFPIPMYEQLMMLDVFFQEHNNFSITFIHEQTARQNILDETASPSFIHSVYAFSCLYVSFFFLQINHPLTTPKVHS